MPAIPSIASFTGASVTEGEFKTALSNLHLFLTGLLGTDGTQAGGQAAMGALLGAGSTTKTASYTVTSADRGKVIACSGDFTVTLPDAGAVGAGFAVAIGNYGDGTITIDPFSSQTLDGATTRALAANRMMVVCAVNGEWLSVGGIGAASTTEAGVVQLSTATDSTSTTLAATPSAVKAAYDLAGTKVSKDQGAVNPGAICVLHHGNSASRTVGVTYASPGAYANLASGEVVIGSAASGTWRFLGVAGTFQYGLYQRVS